MRTAVIIPTVGRPVVLQQTVQRIRRQTTPPEKIVVAAVSASDVEGLDRQDVDVIFSSPGASKQRNAAMDHAGGGFDIYAFFDDDFFPSSSYLESAAELLARDPEIVGLNGTVLADGARGDTVTVASADELLTTRTPGAGPTTPLKALYGCNMVIRASALGSLRFDERLPLYAWLEDIDLTTQLGRIGKLAKAPSMLGVHLGSSGGRTSGVRLGYSQVANVFYLKRKGTLQPGLGRRLLKQNITSNLVRSIKPEPNIDRRGRLRGNLKALWDVARGKAMPEKVLEF